MKTYSIAHPYKPRKPGHIFEYPESSRGGYWAAGGHLRRGAVKTATNYNGDKPKRRQPERRQNGKAKTATTKTATVYE